MRLACRSQSRQAACCALSVASKLGLEVDGAAVAAGWWLLVKIQIRRG